MFRLVRMYVEVECRDEEEYEEKMSKLVSEMLRVVGVRDNYEVLDEKEREEDLE